MPQACGVVCGHALQGGTYLQIKQYAADMCTPKFVSPATFASSRWMGDDQFCTDMTDAVQPFSFEPHNYIGHNLALFPILLVLSYVIVLQLLQIYMSDRANPRPATALTLLVLYSGILCMTHSSQSLGHELSSVIVSASAQGVLETSRLDRDPASELESRE